MDRVGTAPAGVARTGPPTGGCGTHRRPAVPAVARTCAQDVTVVVRPEDAADAMLVTSVYQEIGQWIW